MTRPKKSTSKRSEHPNWSASLEAGLQYIEEYGWACFPVCAKAPQAGSHGHHDATNDPKELRTMFEGFPEADGVAIQCDGIIGPIVVDIDGPDGKKKLTEMEERFGKLPKTLEATSGRRGRKHLYFEPDGEDLKRTLNVDGAKLDILGDGGYVVAPPSIHPKTGKPYRWLNDREPAEVPPTVRKMLGKKKKAAEPLPDVIPIGHRDNLLTSLAGSMRRRNASPQSILAALEAMNDECEEPLSLQDLEKIARSSESWEAGGEHEAELVELNETYAVVQLGSSTLILQDGEEPSFLKQSDFRLWLSNRKITVPASKEGDTKRVPLTQVWLAWEGRRQFDSVVFKPGQEDSPPGEFNLWRGWEIEPSPKGSCRRFLDHLLKIVCNGDEEHHEWLMDWLADAVQRPMGRKPGVAVGIQGYQGAGKSLVGFTIKRILGRYVVVAEKGGHVIGRFNGHLAYCVLLQAEEAFWAGDKKGEATLKHLVTGDTLLIERKGIDSVEMPNYTRVLVTSNEDWVWPTAVGDRRFVLFKARDTYAEKGAASRKDRERYFNLLFKELENGGYAKLLHVLLTRKINDKRLRKPPRTKALEEQAIHSMTPEDAWLREVLISGTLPYATIDDDGNTHILVGRLYESYLASLGKRRYEKNEQAFGLFIKDHLPRAKGVPWMGGSKRFWNRKGDKVQSQRRIIKPLDECRKRYSNRGRAAPQKWPKPNRWRVSK
jgi:hypothetical protein